MKLELKEKAKKLRSQGFSVGEIAKQLEISKSTASLWVRDISLTEEQKQLLSIRVVDDTLKRDLSRSNAFMNRRLEFQKVGSKRIYAENPLYLAGCMLYWGEGSKSRNTVKLTNSSPAMLVLFKKFLLTFFNVQEDDLGFTINCYTDLHSLEEIENYWFKTLSLTRNSLRKGQVNNIPKSSKNDKIGKSEWGTVSLFVYRTDIVQEIYGAIQEYASFNEFSWLK